MRPLIFFCLSFQCHWHTFYHVEGDRSNFRYWLRIVLRQITTYSLLTYKEWSHDLVLQLLPVYGPCVLTEITQVHLRFIDTLLHPTLDFLHTSLIMETSIASDTHFSLGRFRLAELIKLIWLFWSLYQRGESDMFSSYIRITIVRTKSFNWPKFSLKFEQSQRKKSLQLT